MDILKDFILINKQTLKKSFSSIKNNWIIIFAGMFYIIFNTFMILLVSTLFIGPLRILGGLAVAVISASLISHYLYLLYNVINYNKLNIEDFKDGFTFFLRKVYTIFFYSWIFNLLISLILGAFSGYRYALTLAINITLFILLNALPETLYLKVYNPMESIKYSVEFMKENWVNWFIPNVIMFVLFTLIIRNITFSLNMQLFGLLLYVIASGLVSFGMIYRGHLYKLLSTSTRRKRMYMSKL